MARIKLPNKAFGTFIKATHTWLGRASDARTSLEVRLANIDGKLQLSSGADASYIEAFLTVDPEDIKALGEPIFLDVPTLAAYDFDTEGLTMVVPQTEKEDQRITFSVTGFNFRVPRKKGDIWRRNAFDFQADPPLEGLKLDGAGFEKLWKHLELPNSFKTDRSDFRICMKISPGIGYNVYAYDGFGAFCHTFKDDKLEGSEGRMVFLEDFFTPCKAFSVDQEISFGVSERQCFGQFKSPTTGVELLRWTQPQYGKVPSDIPKAINDQRLNKTIHLTLDPRELSLRLDRACMLLSATEMRQTPVEFDVVADQYALTTRKPGGEGEVRSEGKLVLAGERNVKLNVQGGCWKDYLKQFESANVVMEIIQDTSILSQKLPDRELVYWMPLLPGKAQ